MDREASVFTRRGLLSAAYIPPLLGCSTSDGDNGIASYYALVIGVSYGSANDPSIQLKNTVSDARLVSRTLKSVLPEPTIVLDLLDPTYSNLAGAIQQMQSRANRESIVFVYYAGHAVQIDGENYLVANELEALVNINSIIETFRERCGGIVFILDACRENPFAAPPAGRRLQLYSARPAGSRALSSVPIAAAAQGLGLARISIRGAQIMVVFATDPGDIADDVAFPGAANGPFALALAARLPEADDFSEALTGVAASLADRGRNQPGARVQTPWIQSSWTSAIALRRRRGEALPPP